MTKLEEIKQNYSHSDDNSLLAALEMADQAYQAGRESVLVELPSKAPNIKSASSDAIFFRGYNACLSEVKNIIEKRNE